MFLSDREALVVVLVTEASSTSFLSRGIKLGEAASKQGYKTCLIVDTDPPIKMREELARTFSHIIRVEPSIKEMHEEILFELRKLSLQGIQTAGVVAVRDPSMPVATKVAQTLGLPFLELGSLEKAVNKFEGRVAEQRAGLVTPRFALLDSYSSIVEEVGLPLIIKPIRGTSSSGLYHIHNEEEFQRAIEEIEKEDASWFNDFTGGAGLNGFIVEEYIEGREFSAEAIVRNGKVIPVVLTERISTGEIAVTPQIGIWPPFDPNPEELIWKKIQEFVKVYSLNNCLVNIDLRMRGQDCVIIDVNAGRYNGWSGDVMAYLCAGIDLPAEAIAISTGAGSAPRLNSPISDLATRRIMRIPLRLPAKEGVQISSVNGMEKISEHPYIHHVIKNKPDRSYRLPASDYFELGVGVVFANLPRDQATPDRIIDLRTELLGLVDVRIEPLPHGPPPRQSHRFSPLRRPGDHIRPSLHYGPGPRVDSRRRPGPI